MAEKEKDRILENFNRARSRNALEDRLLRRHLDKIENKQKSSLSSINNEITQQRRLVVMLRKEVNMMRKGMSTDNAQMALFASPHGKSSRFGSLESCNKTPADEELREINVAGQRLTITSDIRPHMLFWSQDTSTKLPTMTGFYGYQYRFQRSLTEIKLLGQNVHPDRQGRREVQSADPVAVREITNHNIRRIHTSEQPKRARLPEMYREDTRFSQYNPPPPPTREGNHPVVTVVNEKPAVPKLVTRDSERNNIAPEEINLNLKSLPSEEDLSDPNRSSVRNRIKGTAPGDLRTPDAAKRQTSRSRSRLAEGLIRTREEATKSHQQTLQRRTASQDSRRPKQTMPTTVLERSYTDIPVLMNEVNRLRSDTRSAKEYTKTAFGINMQCAISKKVLNKSGLPPAFRKNYSTYLKHYGTPIMEEKLAPHYNTPVSVMY